MADNEFSAELGEFGVEQLYQIDEAMKSTPAGVRCGRDPDEIIQEEKKHRKEWGSSATEAHHAGPRR